MKTKTKTKKWVSNKKKKNNKTTHKNKNILFFFCTQNTEINEQSKAFEAISHVLIEASVPGKMTSHPNLQHYYNATGKNRLSVKRGSFPNRSVSPDPQTLNSLNKNKNENTKQRRGSADLIYSF